MGQNNCWITSFKNYGSAWFTSDLWIEWGAFWALGLVVARQVYYELMPGKRLYTNLYVMPIGKPGTGKSEAIEAIRSVVDPLKRFNFAPNSATRAAMVDYAKENLSSRMIGGALITSNEIISLNEEFASLVPENDNWYLTTLNELYDCRNRYESRTRSHGIVELTETFSHLYAAAAPQYLALSFPEQAWGTGFMSRTIMVYEGATKRRGNLFAVQPDTQDKKKALIARLQELLEFRGRIEFSDEAKTLIQTWYDNDMEPRPTHPRLEAYCTRRILTLYKLCMIKSLARGNSLVVSGEDARYCLDLLFRTEARMPQIFLDMGGSQQSGAAQDVAMIVRAFFAKYREPMTEAMLIQQLTIRLPPNLVLMTLNTMLAAGIVKVAAAAPIGMRKFLPGTVSDRRLESLYKTD